MDPHPVLAIDLVEDAEVQLEVAALTEQIEGNARSGLTPGLPGGEAELAQLGQPQLVLIARKDQVDVLMGPRHGAGEERVLGVATHERRRRLQSGQRRDQLELTPGEIRCRHRLSSIHHPHVEFTPTEYELVAEV